MRISRSRRAEAIIPTASMADIAFLLIIFFMVTTVHEVDRTSVNLPFALTREEPEKGSAYVVLARVMQDGGETLVYKFSDGKAMSAQVGGPADIYYEASNLIYKDSTTQFIIKADGELQYDKVDEILDTLRKADVQKVLLLAQQGAAK